MCVIFLVSIVYSTLDMELFCSEIALQLLRLLMAVQSVRTPYRNKSTLLYKMTAMLVHYRLNWKCSPIIHQEGRVSLNIKFQDTKSRLKTLFCQTQGIPIQCGHIYPFCNNLQVINKYFLTDIFGSKF